jgi:hypothetical protein
LEATRYVFQILVRKPERKSSHVRLNRHKDNIKMEIREFQWEEDSNGTEGAQDKVQLWTLL